MGLLDLLNKKVSTIGTNPLAMGLLTYGMTGQGSDPLSSGMQAMAATAQAKAKADEAAKLKAQQQALQQAVIGGFSRGTVDPALLAQYAASGGEGAGNLIDMNKFNNTPQQITPGSMVRDPSTGKLSMPAPKMGEGQMWDGQNVTNASGYLQAYGAQKAVDAQTEIDKYAGQQGIGYQYDLGRMGAQNQYDVGKMGYQSDLGRGDFSYQQGVKDSSEMMQVYNPQTGNMDYVSKAGVKAGAEAGLGNAVAARSETAKTTDLEQAKYNETQRQTIVTGGATAAKQLTKLNQLNVLVKQGLEVGGLAPVYQQVGSIAADLGIKVDGLSGIQQAQKVILQLAQEIPLPPGAASNVDVQQRIQQLPNVSDTPQAFAASVKAMQDLAELNILVGEYVQKYGYTPEAQQQINEKYAQWGKGG